MKIIVASDNPVKIQATERSFLLCFPKIPIDVSGISAPSGVSTQPLSEEETLRGAKNRVAVAKQKDSTADYWVGIEGGVEDCNGEMASFAWIYIQARSGQVGKSRTGTFFLPHAIRQLVLSGKELGEADDVIFHLENSKKKQGAVGVLTKNCINRTTYYEQTIILALIPFINIDLYAQSALKKPSID